MRKLHRFFTDRPPALRTLTPVEGGDVIEADDLREAAPNPFLTPMLVSRRAEQRRILRRIPSRLVTVVARWSIKPPQALEPNDATALEEEVRRLATEAVDGLRPVLAMYEIVEFAEPLSIFFGDLIKHRAADLNLGPPHVAALKDALVKMFFEDADALRIRRESMHHTQLDEERAASMLRLIVLLLAADELAHDGYRDPRVDWVQVAGPV
jgi:hypothetical protein